MPTSATVSSTPLLVLPTSTTTGHSAISPTASLFGVCFQLIIPAVILLAIALLGFLVLSILIKRRGLRLHISFNSW